LPAVAALLVPFRGCAWFRPRPLILACEPAASTKQPRAEQRAVGQGARRRDPAGGRGTAAQVQPGSWSAVRAWRVLSASGRQGPTTSQPASNQVEKPALHLFTNL